MIVIASHSRREGVAISIIGLVDDGDYHVFLMRKDSS